MTRFGGFLQGESTAAPRLSDRVEIVGQGTGSAAKLDPFGFCGGDPLFLPFPAADPELFRTQCADEFREKRVQIRLILTQRRNGNFADQLLSLTAASVLRLRICFLSDNRHPLWNLYTNSAL